MNTEQFNSLLDRLIRSAEALAVLRSTINRCGSTVLADAEHQLAEAKTAVSTAFSDNVDALLQMGACCYRDEPFAKCSDLPAEQAEDAPTKGDIAREHCNQHDMQYYDAPSISRDATDYKGLPEVMQGTVWLADELTEFESSAVAEALHQQLEGTKDGCQEERT